MTIKIDIVSDTVCPWCYVGKRRLEQALSQRPEIPVEINWRPFQLNPEMPKEGRDRQEHYLDKFGTKERVKELTTTIEQVGEDVGLDFALDQITRAPNTLSSHRLLRWSSTAKNGAGDGSDNSGGAVQDRIAEALFHAYFMEGRDIGDHAVLAEIAAGAGMDPALVRELLDEGRDEDLIRGEVQSAVKMGVQGVPCFIFNQKYVVSGAQDPAVFVELLDTLMLEAAEAVTIS